MIKTTALCFALLFSTSTLAAEAYVPLEQRMQPEQFKAAGLQKLDAAELAALNAWLAGQTAAAAPVATSEPTPESVAVPKGYRLVPTGPGFLESERDEVESTIDGPFTGWSGYTTFTLANGQVWQQTDRSSLRVRERSGVAVRIVPRMMGVWRMKTDSSNQWVQVKRIK